MKKTKTALLISLLFFGLFFVITPAHAEVIKDFQSQITVLPDSSILVSEIIDYNFESDFRHGIIRSIPLVNSKNKPIKISEVSVTDDHNNNLKFSTSVSSEVLNIKIGDPDVMITARKEYDISYHVFGAIAYYDKFDEIYWNATGNGWTVPILDASVAVILPNNVFPTQQSCYYGVKGSTTKCLTVDSNLFKLNPSTSLAIGEGLTVAVGFPKGSVSVYQDTSETKTKRNVDSYWPILIPILAFIYMFRRWWKYGRDPKGTGVIIAQYDVLDNLTPLEVGGIINEEVKNQNISAEIIYLATRGFIKIKQIDSGVGNLLGLTVGKDYEFTLLKEGGLLTNDFDKKIIKAIFGDDGNVGGVAKLSVLKDEFYQSIPDIDNTVIDTLLNKKYYTNFPKSRIAINIFITAFVIGAVLFTSGFNILNEIFNSTKKIYIYVLSVFLSSIILFIFSRIMSAKSQKGVAAKEYFLGLKEYLQIAEKDRINFHNAPEKKPEIFEALLPYAMVFGVVGIWAKEFQDIYNTQPNWYEGNSTGFNAVGFGKEMSSFSAMSTSALSSSPSSSGSGGGGFSGGGGGGGGGGSW